MTPKHPAPPEPDPAFEALLRAQPRAPLPEAWKAEILANGMPPARHRAVLRHWRPLAMAACWLIIASLHAATPSRPLVEAAPFLAIVGRTPLLVDATPGSSPLPRPPVSHDR